jgi:two-component system, sensor histidine kinase and response regulator
VQLDWRFFPVFQSPSAGSNYVAVYNPALVVTSVVIAIIAAYVALSISGRIIAAKTDRSRWAWTGAGAVVMGGGIWSMHFVGMLAFSLPCQVDYNASGTLLSAIPGILASGVALSIISRNEEPSVLRLTIGAVLMGAGIGIMHYSGMAAMEPAALLRYDPTWVAISVVTAVVLAFISLSIRFRFRARIFSGAPANLMAAAVMGFAVSGMHYTAMNAAIFYPLVGGTPDLQMSLPPTTLAIVVTLVAVLIASVALVASFAGRQAELAANLRAEINERKRGESALIDARQNAERANLAKSQFLAIMSHEIRTPLNGVIGMANLLASTPLNDRQAHLVDSLARSGRTLLALINDILDFSRIEARELVLFEAPFEIREVIAEVTDLFAEQGSTKNLELVYSVSEEVPAQLLGDSVRLRQVLINLVGNAMKFTEQGEVVVEVSVAEQNGDDVVLSFAVQDTGIGIAPDKLDQVFEPFRQADASMTRSHGGTGLGLAITKHLVELMGGTIAVQSQLGRGSRFEFKAHFSQVPRPAKAAEERRRIARPLRTLLVDANATSARVLRDYLTRWGMAPVVVDTAPKAAAKWKAALAAHKEFDAAIIDVKGLGAAGIELARTIGATEDGKGAKLVLLVGMNDLASNYEIEKLAAFAILTKPARPSALFDCFASIAAGAAGNGVPSPVTRRNVRAVTPSFNARILVVEDNAVNQEVAAGILEEMDCRVVTAANGKSAVEHFQSEAFDLILMDCEMPVLDGFAATKRIREIEAERSASGDAAGHTPVIALTAHALAEIRQKCLHVGMDDFLVKPFDEVQIGEMLRLWIPDCEQAPRHKTETHAETRSAANRAAESGLPPIIDMNAINRIRAIRGRNGDSLFERVVGQFADTAPSLVAAVRQHWEAADAEGVWRAAHSLKSSAATLGAERLARRCVQIETLARNSGVDAVRSLVEALESDLIAAQEGLRNLVEAEHV